MVFPIEAFAPKCIQSSTIILLYYPKIACYKDFTIEFGSGIHLSLDAVLKAVVKLDELFY